MTIPTWLTATQAMKHIQVSRGTFYRLIREGKITQYTAPGLADPRYSQEELDAMFTPTAKDEAQTDE